MSSAISSASSALPWVISQRGPYPVGAVDGQARLAPHPGRNKLVYGRVDGRVLSADPHPREEPEHHEAKEPPREGRQDREEQVDGERDEEQLPATVPVGKIGEKQPSQGRPGGVDSRGVPYLRIGEPEPGGRVGEYGGYVGHDHHLDPVQDPGDAQGRNHQSVESTPRQPVNSGG